MARLLLKSTWFDEMSIHSSYETEFEQVILSRAPELFPGFHACSFKPIVCNDEESAKPDLALVDHAYQHWWVVEVEMGYHSFDRHVLPQVRTLCTAVYGEAEAAELCRANSSLDLAKVKDMFKGGQPRVLVIANRYYTEWAEKLKVFGAEVTGIEVFRSDRNEFCLRIVGFTPIAVSEASSDCIFDSVLPSFLEVRSPAVLSIEHGQTVEIDFLGTKTVWKRVDSADKVWLAPVGKTPAFPKKRFKLTRNSVHQFYLEGR